jgi:hypothetical protein
VRVELKRGSDVIGVMAIFGAAVSGYASVGAWVAIVAALALASLSQAEHNRLYQHTADLGFGGLGFSFALKSMMNALVASGSAYFGGVLLNLMSQG